MEFEVPKKGKYAKEPRWRPGRIVVGLGH